MAKYGNAIPWLLRMMGCTSYEPSSMRFRWGEFAPQLVLALTFQPHGHLILGPLFGWFFIRTPWMNADRDMDAPRYGFSLGSSGWGTLFLYWGRRTKVVNLPWGWISVRRTILRTDGSPWRDVTKEFLVDVPVVLKEQHLYRYLRYGGDVQVVTATMYGEEWELRLRGAPWFSWVRRVSRSIQVSFSEEIGEGAGSWKGGVIGTSHEWREDEPMLAALRRMERERYFSR